MSVLAKLAIKSLKHRKLSVALSIVSVALGVVLLLGVERIRHQVKESFSNTISGTDLIVGARTSDISLLLSSIFHLGYANQNVSYSTFRTVSHMPEVQWAIPLSLGDSYNGYPVLGTTDAYLNHFRFGNNQQLAASKGILKLDHTEAILGAKVASDLNYSIGDTILVTHGMGEENFISHKEEPFIVTGILKPTGTPLDKVIHVSLFAIDEIHRHFYKEDSFGDDPLAMDNDEIFTAHQGTDYLSDGSTDDHIKNPPKSLTAFILGLKDRRNIPLLQRKLNEFKREPITAILPVVTLTDLWRIVSPVEKALFIISMLVLLVTFAGILTTLMTSLQERRREMAVLRSVGASVSQLFRLMLIETMSITCLGIILGCVILLVLLIIVKPYLALYFGILFTIDWLRPGEWLLLSIIWLGGTFTGLWPAYQSYKTSLADGLNIKI